MNKNVQILDCTLRDGGYVNDFNFGRNVICDIIGKLAQSGVEIIECGFLKSEAVDVDKSLFLNAEAVKCAIKTKQNTCMYVAMIDCGQISADEITVCDGSGIEGIRVTFRKHEIDDAVLLGKNLMEKGYKVFMQPLGTITYADIDLLKLVERINEMNPYALYLVDTFGTMYKNNLLRMFYLIDNNLNPDICIGFHSHNNLQLAFSNAQELMLLNSPRKIIIDTSCYGMGRGAGNLCTELLMNYVNENIKKSYDLMCVMEIIDKYILPIFTKTPWGYTMPYYIASINHCHPNYASYLINKHSVLITDINRLIARIPPSKKSQFDRQFIREIYNDFLSNDINDTDAVDELRKRISGKEVMLIAPGNSVSEQHSDISDYIENNNPVVIVVNANITSIKHDFIFLSNQRRFQLLKDDDSKSAFNIINTSNIKISDNENTYFTINYSDYLSNDEDVSDNAGIMVVNLLEKLKIKKLALAGFDGFSHNYDSNYYSEKMQTNTDMERIKKMNIFISKRIDDFRRNTPVVFVTKSIYEKE